MSETKLPKSAANSNPNLRSARGDCDRDRPRRRRQRLRLQGPHARLRPAGRGAILERAAERDAEEESHQRGRARRAAGRQSGFRFGGCAVAARGRSSRLVVLCAARVQVEGGRLDDARASAASPVPERCSDDDRAAPPSASRVRRRELAHREDAADRGAEARPATTSTWASSRSPVERARRGPRLEQAAVALLPVAGAQARLPEFGAASVTARRDR